MKKRRPNCLVVSCHIAIILTLISSAAAQAQGENHASDTAAKTSSYVRVTYESERPEALQTSVARFRPKHDENELFVDLVAAVHLGDKAYYETLNKLFARYDVVLYELVAPPGNELPDPEADDGNPMRAMLRMMQSMLGLSSQMEEVDYTATNFVHADMSPAEMSEALKSRGDTPVTFALSALADVLRQANIETQNVEAQQEQPTITQQDVLSLLTSRRGGADLKRQMAVQLSRLGGSAGALGPTIGQLLVSDRNAAAMKVFQRELAQGRKKIAIFYGAAHMPDFHKRLEQDFGLTHAHTEWITAWNLTKSSESSTKSPLSAFLELLQQE